MDQLSLSLGNKRGIDHQVRVRIGSADLIVSEVFDRIGNLLPNDKTSSSKGCEMNFR